MPPPGLPGDGLHRHGPTDIERRPIDRAGGRAARLGERAAAVGRVIDGCPFRRRRKCHAHRFCVQAALDAGLGRLDDALVETDIADSGRRDGHEAQLRPAVGVAPVGDIDALRAEGYAVEQGDAVGSEQADLLPFVAEPKARVQAGIADVAVGPDHQEAACRNRGGGGIARRNLPFRRPGQVVRKIEPAHVDGGGAGVIQLDPVVIMALRVPGEVAVGGENLIDNRPGR